MDKQRMSKEQLDDVCLDCCNCIKRPKIVSCELCAVTILKLLTHHK